MTVLVITGNRHHFQNWGMNQNLEPNQIRQVSNEDQLYGLRGQYYTEITDNKLRYHERERMYNILNANGCTRLSLDVNTWPIDAFETR